MPDPQPRLSLYMYPSCGYCQHVIEALEPLDLEVELVDIRRVPAARDELVEATGRGTVPVLRVEGEGPTRWMPESLDIIRELRRRAGVESRVPVWVDRAAQISRPVGLITALLSLAFDHPTSDVLLWSGIGLIVLGILRRRLG